MSLLTAPESLPFAVALTLLVAIALIEGIGLFVSLSPSSLLDHLTPGLEGDSGIDHLLGWLHVGRVPSLVLLVLFLAGFALGGYALQGLVDALIGHYLPAALAGPLGVPFGIAAVRLVAAPLARILPRDENGAVSEQELIGRTAVITGGAARRGLAAQARVRDDQGHTLYLMVEPDLDDEVFGDGDEVLLVRKVGAFYRCIRNPHPTRM